MGTDLKAALGWTMVQFVMRPQSTPPTGYVVDDEFLQCTDDELRDVRSELITLQAAGIPPDEDKGRPRVEHIPFRCPGTHEDESFYVLKPKPDHWRLYFVADIPKQKITFLYVVSKKKWKREKEDLKVCCARLKKLRKFAEERVPCIDYLPDRLIS